MDVSLSSGGGSLALEITLIILVAIDIVLEAINIKFSKSSNKRTKKIRQRVNFVERTISQSFNGSTHSDHHTDEPNTPHV